SGPYWEDVMVEGGALRVAHYGNAFLRECQQVVATLERSGKTVWLVKSSEGVRPVKQVHSGVKILLPDDEENRGLGRPRTHKTIALNKFLHQNIEHFANFTKMDFIPYGEINNVDPRTF